jgi:hypothetical protein
MCVPADDMPLAKVMAEAITSESKPRHRPWCNAAASARPQYRECRTAGRGASASCRRRRRRTPSSATARRLERQSGRAGEAAALVLAGQEFVASGGGRSSCRRRRTAGSPGRMGSRGRVLGPGWWRSDAQHTPDAGRTAALPGYAEAAGRRDDRFIPAGDSRAALPHSLWLSSPPRLECVTSWMGCCSGHCTGPVEVEHGFCFAPGASYERRAHVDRASGRKLASRSRLAEREHLLSRPPGIAGDPGGRCIRLVPSTRCAVPAARSEARRSKAFLEPRAGVRGRPQTPSLGSCGTCPVSSRARRGCDGGGLG